MFKQLAYSLPVVVVLTAGCSPHRSVPPTIVVPANTTLKTQPAEVRLIRPGGYILGKANAVEVRELRAITVGDRLQVQATLFNNRGRPDQVYYRMRWLDRAGMMVGQYAPWDSETLEGFQSSVLTFTAPAAQITDFRIEIRPRD